MVKQKIIKTLEEIISEFGEIPLCQCKGKCGRKVFVDPKYHYKYKIQGYPKYCLGHQNFGKTATEETKLKQSKTHKGKSCHSEEWKENLRNNNPMSRPEVKFKIMGKLNPFYGKQIPHGHKVYLHKTPLQDGVLMHNWDDLYASYLDSNNIQYLYEMFTFELLLNNKDTTYTPDFYIPSTDSFVEIKGYFRDDAESKFNKFKEIYPSINIEVLMKQDLQKLGIKIRKSKRRLNETKISK